MEAETITIKKQDFDKILNTAEILIDEVEDALSQDELVRKRIDDIKTGRIAGKTEEDYYEYLKKRGIKIK